MGFAFNQHDGGWLALSHGFGPGKMGCCALPKHAAETIESRANVGTGEAGRRQDEGIWLRLAHRRYPGPSINLSRWSVAGIQIIYRASSRRQTNTYLLRQLVGNERLQTRSWTHSDFLSRIRSRQRSTN